MVDLLRCRTDFELIKESFVQFNKGWPRAYLFPRKSKRDSSRRTGMHEFAIEMRGCVPISTSGSFRSVNKGSVASIGGSFNFVGIAFWVDHVIQHDPTLLALSRRA
jgi:hypothetical protein